MEMDSGISGPQVTSRPDEGMPTATAPMEIPTVPPPAPPPEEHVPEMRGHSNSGGGDVAAKTEMVICDPSYADPAKTKAIDKVVSYTNIPGAPVSYLPNEDGNLIDTGQIIIAQKLQECKNDIDVTMVSWGHCVTSKGQVRHFREHRHGELERCLFVRESNETRVVSHVDDPLTCAKPADAWKNLDAHHEVGRDQERRSSQPTAFIWFTWDSSTEVYTMVIDEDSQ